MGILQKLTEGIVKRDFRKETSALVQKWEKIGLLEGLSGIKRDNLVVLLENEAKELLREATTMEAGAVEGFAAVAFPLVRRVFGELIAQDLVSVQPMSLPAGLIFFMDFVRNAARGPFAASESIYGGGVTGSGIASGISLTSSSAETGYFNLSQGYSKATGSTIVASSSFTYSAPITLSTGSTNMTDANKLIFRFDADLLSEGDDANTAGTNLYLHKITVNPSSSWDTQFDVNSLMAVNATGFTSSWNNRLIRRLTDYTSGVLSLFVVSDNGTGVVGASANITITFPVTDTLAAGTSLGSIVGSNYWPLENETDIPELNIKVNSLPIVAGSRKLKAKWTPELEQDLGAFHNVDPEVELTGIMSETVALDIDQEILGELIKGGTAGKLYWSRRPGKFVNRLTGADITSNGANLPDFTGNVSQWYETLVETMNDLSADIHRKTLRGGATFVVTSPEIANILEFTAGFRADVTGDAEKGSVGTYKNGSINKKWDIYVDPYFPRNVILMGRKGKGFLESGFCYAPYVPLEMTPVILDPDDFTPRRGCLTRYAKKMVRSDMYGLVIVTDLEG